MFKIVFFVIALFFFSCSRREDSGDFEPRSPDTARSPATIIEEFDPGREEKKDSEGLAVPSQPAVSSGSTAAPASRAASAPPAVTVVRENLDHILLNSSGSVFLARDVDLGMLPESLDDPRLRTAGRFLQSLVSGSDFESLLHPVSVEPVSRLAGSIQNELDLTSYRLAELRPAADAVLIPFRIYNRQKTGTGYLQLAMHDQSWRIRDIIFDPQVFQEISREPFAPSTYRWMEVF